MSNTNTGGPAFPTTIHNYGDGSYCSTGLSLRDYFAAKAMQAILNDPSWRGHVCSTAASTAYEMADAMLKAREQ